MRTISVVEDGVKTYDVFDELDKVKNTLAQYASGKIVPVCVECKKELSPDELGYGHDCEGN